MGMGDHAEGLGLDCSRVNDKEAIAEDALLFVTEPVGLQNDLAALRTRHDE